MEYTYKYDIEKLRGTKINKLTILEEGEKIRESGKNRRTFICKCECGNEKQVQVRLLMKGIAKSCGNCPPEDRTGETRGHLEILKEVESKHHARRYEVKCNNCGTHKEMDYAVFNKKTHCGCLTEKKPIPRRPLVPLNLPILKGVYNVIEEIGIKETKEGRQRIVKCQCTKCGAEHEKNYTNINSKVSHCTLCASKGFYTGKLSLEEKRLSTILASMRIRCYDKSSKDYKNYGGRGIAICDDWMEFRGGKSRFREWALSNGYDIGLEIDRIDNNGIYSPDNCRFVTRRENGRNKRNVKLTVEDVKEIRYGKYKDLPISEIAEIFKIARTSIKRIKDFTGWKGI